MACVDGEDEGVDNPNDTERKDRDLFNKANDGFRVIGKMMDEELAERVEYFLGLTVDVVGTSTGDAVELAAKR